MTPARAVFLGTGSFAVPALEIVASHPSVELVGVITAPPRPAGRGRRPRSSPVAAWCEANRMHALTPARLRAPESVDAIRALSPALLVLADYGQIVPRALLDLPPHGALNVHPSLLPRHRGATPIQATIATGDRETGVSIIRMDEGLDTGPIVAQRRIALDGRETAPELEGRLAHLGAEVLREVLPPWLAGELREVPQPAEGASVTSLLRRADGALDPARPAAELERRVRAFQPWPGSFLATPSGRIVVHAARPVPALAGPFATDTPHPEAGALMRGDGGELWLVTADGVLELVEVQPEGGRRMSGAELLRGRPAFAGSRVASGTLG